MRTRFSKPRENSLYAAPYVNELVEQHGGHLCPINQLSRDHRTIGNFKPLCPIKLNNCSSFALIDSGNVIVNAISEKFALRLFSGKLEENLQPLSYTHIGTADQKARMRVLGVTKQPLILRFGGASVRFYTSPIVIRDLNTDVNISGPFLADNGIDQIHSKGALKVKGKLVRLFTYKAAVQNGATTADGSVGQLALAQTRSRQEMDGMLPLLLPSSPVGKSAHGRSKQTVATPPKTVDSNAYVAATVRIPANAAAFIPIHVTAVEAKQMSAGTGLLEVCERFADKTTGHPTLIAAVRTDSSGHCFSSLLNLTDSEIEIKEGQLFGTYQPWDPERQPTNTINSLQSRLNAATAVNGDQKPVTKQEKKDWLEKEFHLKDAPWLKKDPLLLSQAQALLLEFYDIMSHGDDYGKTTLVEHEIRTQDVPPVRLKGRPLNPHMEANLKEQMDTWERQGVIEPSNSPWSFGLIPVQKKNGKTRWCVDFRRLNEITLKDSYPLPNMESNLSRLAHSKVFSAIDGAGAFHAVSIRAEDRPKTAFHTPWGLWQFKQMPFGLCNAPSTYSRLVQRVLEDIPPSVALPYMDDTAIHSRTTKEHLAALYKVFAAHRKAGLTLQPSKCQLFQEEIDYLGHRVTGTGVRPREDYLAIVRDWPLPKDLKGWRAFLGKAAYYRKFIKGFSAISAPLYSLLSKEGEEEAKQSADVGSKVEKSFQQLKTALVTAPLLAYPDFESSAPFILDTDWSADPGAIGGVLSQEQGGEERVICYGARKLSKAERNYSSNKGELLAAIHFMKTWRYYFQHRPFIWRTDHQALQWIRTMEEPQGMILRWLETLSNNNFTVQFRDGIRHGNADGLSRSTHAREPNADEIAASEEETHYGICQLGLPDQTSIEDLKKAQGDDADLAKIKGWVEKAQKPTRGDVRQESRALRQYVALFELLKVDSSGLLRRTAREGEFVKEDRLCLPEALQIPTIRECHENAGGHMGINTTQQRLLQRFYFPGLHKTVEQFVGSCRVCQKKAGRNKDQRHTLVSIQEGNPMQKLSIDFVGPLRMSKHGHQFILTVKDCFTRWLEAIPMAHITAEETIRMLEEHVFSRWGLPEQIHSDQGSQFTSEMFGEICRRLNIKKTVTPAYNPKSNPVERSHKDLSNIIRAVSEETGQDWEEILPTALLAMRTARHRYTGVTPFYAMHGREANIPVDLMYENPRESKEHQSLYGLEMESRMLSAYKYMREKIGASVERSRMSYDGKLHGAPLKAGEQVWLFTPVIDKKRGKKHSCFWSGPWLVQEVVSDVMFKIKTDGEWNSGRIDLIASIDRLKRYHVNPDMPPSPMNLSRSDVIVSDEFAEQASDPDELPQFNPVKLPILYPGSETPRMEEFNPPEANIPPGFEPEDTGGVEDPTRGFVHPTDLSPATDEPTEREGVQEDMELAMPESLPTPEVIPASEEAEEDRPVQETEAENVTTDDDVAVAAAAEAAATTGVDRDVTTEVEAAAAAVVTTAAAAAAVAAAAAEIAIPTAAEDLTPTRVGGKPMRKSMLDAKSKIKIVSMPLALFKRKKKKILTLPRPPSLPLPLPPKPLTVVKAKDAEVAPLPSVATPGELDLQPLEVSSPNTVEQGAAAPKTVDGKMDRRPGGKKRPEIPSSSSSDNSEDEVKKVANTHYHKVQKTVRHDDVSRNDPHQVQATGGATGVRRRRRKVATSPEIGESRAADDPPWGEERMEEGESDFPSPQQQQ